MAEDVQGSYYEGGVRAPVTTQTYTLDVAVEDSNGDVTTFKIDNPKAQITLSEVQTVFANAINTNHWVSRNNFPFTQVKTAKRVTTVKTVEALE